jgi:hypothetical protein
VLCWAPAHRAQQCALYRQCRLSPERADIRRASRLDARPFEHDASPTSIIDASAASSATTARKASGIAIRHIVQADVDLPWARLTLLRHCLLDFGRMRRRNRARRTVCAGQNEWEVGAFRPRLTLEAAAQQRVRVQHRRLRFWATSTLNSPCARAMDRHRRRRTP